MLKALELSGFKSFADRTRFEFPPGISVVVGPNGSGKSNVVDAVKWVLGSQSAKSLRGKEMTDVIFNGCASRGPLGTAEVTLTLDNADGRLAIDAKDVHVTRRVYRSGEGEYLINRQPCRLKDIRELLVSTGITTEAYCIIEQGRVDALLQSSPKDRRGIFEEAAGISQFKLKKATAQRRMERAAALEPVPGGEVELDRAPGRLRLEVSLREGAPDVVHERRQGRAFGQTAALAAAQDGVERRQKRVLDAVLEVFLDQGADDRVDEVAAPAITSTATRSAVLTDWPRLRRSSAARASKCRWLWRAPRARSSQTRW